MIFLKKNGHKVELKKGDILWVKSFFFFKHPILYIGDCLFIDNQPNRGVNYADFSREVKNRVIENITRLDISESEIERVIIKAKKLIGKPYQYRFYNCEHFINEIFGVTETTQVENILKIIDNIA